MHPNVQAKTTRSYESNYIITANICEFIRHKFLRSEIPIISYDEHFTYCSSVLGRKVAHN